VYWIKLAQNRSLWRDAVNTVVNRKDCIKGENIQFFISICFLAPVWNVTSHSKRNKTGWVCLTIKCCEEYLNLTGRRLQVWNKKADKIVETVTTGNPCLGFEPEVLRIREVRAPLSSSNNTVGQRLKTNDSTPFTSLPKPHSQYFSLSACMTYSVGKATLNQSEITFHCLFYT
jgi:hypothetical protein